MSQIFLNYRTEDTGFGVAMLDQALSRQFGDQAVFLASKSIRLGAEWESEMFRAVADSTALLAIIGRNWLDAKDVTGQRRIDDPNDFVRREIVTAFELEKQVIPVRLGTGRFSARELPEELRPLLERQDIEIRFRQHRPDLETLVRKLRSQIPALRRAGSPDGAGAGKFALRAERIDSVFQTDQMTVQGDFRIGGPND